MIFSQPEFMKGMNYAGFGREVFASKASDQAIDHLLKINANWVAINVFWYQESRHSLVINRHETKTVSDESLLHLIRYLKSAGVKIMLKPMVDARDGTWRGHFRPLKWASWFDSYSAFITHYAALAEEQALDLFCVGCEFPIDLRKQLELWVKLIMHLKNVYSGPMTYASNFKGKGGYQQIPFWLLLDYIGIDAYFPISSRRAAKVPHMMKGWRRCLKRLEKWYHRAHMERKVLFTELGVTSSKGGAKAPWRFRNVGSPNWLEQAHYYESFFESFQDKDWLKGVFWWWWDNPSTSDYIFAEGKEYLSSYTPKGKNAEEVLKKYFS